MGVVLTTPPDYVALSIALGILFLTAVVEPVVTTYFHRVRAERAWRLIEKEQPVEVTKYPLVSEALGDRGRWDTARIVTYLLFGFHIATTALELSLDLAIRTDGPVDLLNRPPPVISRTELVDPEHTLTDWRIVMGANPGDLKDKGTLGNFKGSLENGNASHTYRVDNRIVRGKTIFATWSTEFAHAEPHLFYNATEGSASVEAIACTVPLRTASVYVLPDGSGLSAEEKWGVAMECENGPMPTTGVSTDGTNPPAIIMASSGGEAHYVVVEEDSSYPSFMYSVWRAASAVEIVHVFHIATNTRMVEAIVTGIANGIVSGGGCVDLLTQFSVSNKTYTIGNSTRVSPFGEHPDASSVESLDQVEPIVGGVLVSNLGVACGLLIMVVTATAMVGGVCLRSRRSLDVYDRDEVIRAVSLPDGDAVAANGKPKAVKLFVRRSDANGFSIIISDDGVYRGGCTGLAKTVVDKIRHRGRPATTNTPNVDTAVAAGHENIPTRGDGLDRRISAGSRFIAFDGVHSIGDDKSSTSTRAFSPGLPRVGDETRTPRRKPAMVELIASPIPQEDDGVIFSRALGMMGLKADSCRSLRLKVANEDAVTPVAPPIEYEV